MTNATQRVMRGFLLLAVVFVSAVVGYRAIHGMNWLEAAWMAVNCITNTGAESSTRTPSFQLFTMVVVVTGFFASAYAFTGLIHMLLEGEIDRYFGKRRMERDIKKLQKHVVVCGYGRLGSQLVQDLVHEKQVVVIDNEHNHAQQAIEDGYMVVEGDATEEEVLSLAGVERAGTLVMTLPSDAANVFIALTARDMCPDLLILARAESPSTERKLLRAGANKVILPTNSSAKQMLRMITRPSTAHLIDLIGEKSFLDVEMDELLIHQESNLVGQSVAESQLNYRHKLLVVAVKQEDHSMVFNPGASYQFNSGDVAIVMGNRQAIQGFCDSHQLPAP